MALSVVIMAGGKGERFWPRSRLVRPKQFLRLCGSGTMLQETFRRALGLVPADQVFVVTPSRYRDLTRQQLPELPAGNLILEPTGRDTAPSIGLAAVVLEHRDPEGTMIVLPADHVITNEERFISALSAAAAVASRGECLVTIGIAPTRPETGYGYIQFGDVLDEEDAWQVRAVRRFTEKPPAEDAMAFLSSGDYLWNGGMFAWRTDTVRAMIATHIPWLHEGLEAIAKAREGPNGEERVREIFLSFPRLSIDYGLLEQAENVAVIPGDFGWDDVGSWAALERVFPLDERGNATDGRVVAMDTENCTLSSPDRLMVTYGVEGLLVVDAPDAVLVADRARSSDLKVLLEELRRRGLHDYLDDVAGDESGDDAGNEAGDEAGDEAFPGLSVDSVPPQTAVDINMAADMVADTGSGFGDSAEVMRKPWGHEVWWARTNRYVGKIIEVWGGHSLSLQYHNVKLETMLFTRGRGVLVVGERLLPIRAGLCVTIPPGVVHRVTAEEDVQFFEVSTPETDDVVRLADAYGRAGAGAATGAGAPVAKGVSTSRV